MPMLEAENRIDERFRDGGAFAEIEDEIIDPAPVSEEQRAALWLYASATFPGHLAEAVAETSKRQSSSLARIRTALRFWKASLSRGWRNAQSTRGEVPHGGA